MNRGRIVLMVTGLALVLVFSRLAWLSGHGEMQFESDIEALLPVANLSPWVDELEHRVGQERQQRLMLLVRGKSPDAVDLATDTLEASIGDAAKREGFDMAFAHHPDPGSLLSRLDALSAFHDVLLGDADAARLRDDPDSLLRDRLESLAAFPPTNLSDPIDDPLGTVERFVLERMTRPGALRHDGMYLRAGDEPGVNLVVVELPAEEPGGANARKAIAGIQQAIGQMSAGRNVEVLVSGMPLHAVEMRLRVISEIRWMAVLGLVISLGCFIWVTRSARALLLTGFTLLVAGAAGLVIVQGTLGLPHLVGLVMATTAIGISVDYAFHYWVHAGAGYTGDQVRKNIAPGVNLSLVTTLLGFGALVPLAVPTLAQTALFIVGALLATWVCVQVIYPACHGPGVKRIRAGRTWSGPSVRTMRIAIFTVMTFALSALALNYQVDDRPVRLGSLDPAQVATDLELAETTELSGGDSLYLVTGADAEDLLKREESLLAELTGPAMAQVLSVSRLVPSGGAQFENHALLQSGLAAMDAEARAAFSSALGADDLEWAREGERNLELSWVLDQPWAETERSLVISSDPERYGSVIHAWGDAPRLLGQPCASMAGCERVSFQERGERAFASLRKQLLQALAVVLVIISVVLTFRYRSGAVRVLAVPVVAILSGLGLVAGMGLPVTAFSLAALFPLVGMSLDYAIFHRECGADDGLTARAVSAAALTTTLSFGVLCLSSLPAVLFFALPVVAGIPAAWLAVQTLNPPNRNLQHG